MRVVFDIKYNNFPKIAAALPGAAAIKVEESARAIEGSAKVRCPVDTGNLRASIQAEPTNNSRLRWLVGTIVEYAPYVELGVRSKPGYPVQPYLTPAAEKERSIFIRNMQELERLL